VVAYPIVKQLHVACVALSLAGFAARGGLMVAGSRLLNASWVRIAPHVIDTVLLASGIWLAWQLNQYPIQQPWLTAKVVGLLGYIALGMVALRRGRTKAIRVTFFGLALAVAGYVVSVAITRNPGGPFAW